MDHARMIRYFGIELFENSGASKLVCEGLIGRRPKRRQGIGVKYLGFAILGVSAMELLQGICVGTPARWVVELFGPFVEAFNLCKVIASAWFFPAYGFGFFDCPFSL